MSKKASCNLMSLLLWHQKHLAQVYFLDIFMQLAGIGCSWNFCKICSEMPVMVTFFRVKNRPHHLFFRNIFLKIAVFLCAPHVVLGFEVFSFIEIIYVNWNTDQACKTACNSLS